MEENTQDLSEDLAQDSSDLGEDSRESLNSDSQDSHESRESNDDSQESRQNLRDLKKRQKFLDSIPKNANGKFLPDNKQLKELVKFEDIKLSQIDTSNVTNMKELFKNSKRTDFSGIEDWNVSKVTTFFECFYYCKAFNSDLSKWKTSSATNFMRMFCGAENFDCDLSEWDTRLVTNMIDMFRSARAFNGDISAWKTNSLEFMWWMFWGAESFNQPLNDWDVSRVKNMNNLFMSAKNFNQPLDKWNVQNVESMEKIFNGAESFNQDLSAWGDKIAKVQNLRYAFAKTKSLERDFLGAWKTAQNCDKTNIIKGSKLEVSKATNKVKLQDFTIRKLDKNSEFQGVKPRDIKIIKENVLDGFKLYENKTRKIYEIFGNRFLLEIGENSEEGENIEEGEAIHIYQARNERKFSENADFTKADCLELYSGENITIYASNNAQNRDLWIINSDLTDNSEEILGIVHIFLLIQAYLAKMDALNNLAKKEDKKNLHESHKEICEFDLHYYQNFPTNGQHYAKIWEKFAEFYRVRENHDELKETIAQIAQLTNDENRDKLNRVFSVAAIFIALASLVVSSVSLVKSL